MSTINCGVDFHARKQTVCYLKTEDGALVVIEFKHQDKDESPRFLMRSSVHTSSSG